MQQAEEESNAAKFVTSLKFVSLLFTTNHATKYTHIAADFLAWWHCASDATQTIFEKVIMTRETRHGKTIFMDRFVEWIVKDMRSGVGKFYRRGTDAKIDRQAVLLSAKKEFKAVFAKEKGKEKTREVKSSRKLGRVFCLALKCLDDDELWKKRDINRLSLRPDKPELNYQMLDLPLLGEARMNTWIDVNMKGLGEENDQSTKDAQLLKRIQPTVEKRMADDKDDVERSTSTTVTFVLDKYTAAELKKVYQQLKEKWHDSWGTLPTPNAPKNKPQYAEVVCDCRKLIIAKSPEWVQSTTDALEQAISQRDEAAASAIREQLNRTREAAFFHLWISDELKNAYSKRHAIHIDGEAEEESQPVAESQGSAFSLGLNSISSL